MLTVTFSVASRAQFSTAYTFPVVAGDTLNNVDSVAKLVRATAGYNCMGFKADLNKLSGTVAGKLYLYASNTNDSWALIDSATYSPIPAGVSGTTMGALNGYTHTAVIQEPRVPWTYYLVVPTSSGTVQAPVRVSYILRKNIAQ